jgi:hypothetical protein
MEQEKAREPYWCETAPNVQRVWSSSSLSTIAECPRRYELAYIEGWTPKGENLDLLFGIRWHDLMEAYWTLRGAGADQDQCLNQLVPEALNFKLPAPQRQSQAGKTPLSLARSLVWYFDQYKQDEIETIIRLPNGRLATETHFTLFLDLANPDGEPYQLQGYLDSLRSFGGFYTVWDYKTTAGSISDFYIERFRIDLQNFIYTLAAQTLTKEKFTCFMIDAIGVGVSYTNCQRFPLQVTQGELEEAVKDIITWIVQAERYAESGYYPKNPKACGFCDYKGICDKDPSSRFAFLKSNFDEKRRETVGRS